MKTKSPMRKFAALLAATFFSCALSAQNPSIKVFEDWRDTAGTQNTFYRAITRTIPGTTNVMVAGATLNSNGNYDMLVEKLSGSGSVIWAQQFNGPGNGDDIATDVQVDGSGNVYITGTYYEDAVD